MVGGYTVLQKPNKGLVLSLRNAYVDVTARKSGVWVVRSEYGYWTGTNPKKIPEKLRFVKHAILESEISEPHILDIKSSALLRPDRKIGLGSSAAVTHAVIEALRPEISKEELFSRAYRAHSAAQGKVGSGFDIASSVFGTIVYERPSEIGAQDYKVECVDIPKDFHLLVYNIRGGGTNTAVSVRTVLRAIETNPKAKKTFHELAELNNSAISLFKRKKLDEFLELLREINACRRLLGELAGVPIEPRELDKIRQKIERDEYVTVLPGAGGFDSLVVVGLQPIKPIKHEMLEEVRVLLRRG